MARIRGGYDVPDDHVAHRIRDLVEHQYLADAFVREILQNADDAKATRLVFALDPNGIDGAKNPLLRGPLLWIANDGALKAEDEMALHRSTGGNKGTDETKVGRFGLGLKSIFHWCETFLYCGLAGGGKSRSGVVNPYVRANGMDPKNPAWQEGDADQQALEDKLHALLGGGRNVSDGLVLCAPLRVDAHLNRGDMRLADWRWLPEVEPVLPMLVPDLGRPVSEMPQLAELVLILSQCANLAAVSGQWPGGNFEVARRRDSAAVTLGRHELGAGAHVLAKSQTKLSAEFEVMASSGANWSATVGGFEATGPVGLGLRERSDWPTDLRERDDAPGEYAHTPRKALGHGAVTAIRWNARHLPNRLAARWAAFLPLHSAFDVTQAAAATAAKSDFAIDFILHGYFFPKPDRKGFAGVTEHADDNSVVGLWNLAVAQLLCLPQLPLAAVECLSEEAAEARPILVALAKTVTELAKGAFDVGEAAVRTHVLLPVAKANATRFEAVSREELAGNRPVCAWGGIKSAPWCNRLLQNFAVGQGLHYFERPLVVDNFAPALPQWSANEVCALLAKLEVDGKAAADEMAGVVAFLVETFSSPLALHGGQDEASAVRGAALAWIVRAQLGGWGPGGGKWKSFAGCDEVAQLMCDWLARFGGESWSVSRGARHAVERIAAAEFGLILVPDGKLARRSDSVSLTKACLAILDAVCGRIDQAEGGHGDIGPKSWRLLARDLVRTVGLDALRRDPRFADRALIPSWEPRQPGERLVSAKDLADAAKFGRVFFQAPQVAEEADEPKTIADSLTQDKKQLLGELAMAFGATPGLFRVVQVEDDQFGRITCADIAEAIGKNAERVSQSPDQRLPLFERLCADQSVHFPHHRELRLLAHGNAAKFNATDPLWYLPDDENTATAARAILRAGGRDWAIVPQSVRNQVGQAVLKGLGIQECNTEAVLAQLRSDGHVLDPHKLSAKEREAILRVAAVARDKELFFQLPLHQLASADPQQPKYGKLPLHCYLVGRSVPPELASDIEIVIPARDDMVVAAYEAWLCPLRDQDLVAVIFCHSEPHRFARLLLELAGVQDEGGSGRPAWVVDFRNDFNGKQWVPIGERAVAPRDLVIDGALDASAQLALGEFVAALGKQAIATSSELDASLRHGIVELTNILNRQRSAEEALVDILERLRPTIPGPWVTVPTKLDLRPDFVEFFVGHGPIVRCRRGWALTAAIGTGPNRNGRRLAHALRGNLGTDDWIATLNAVVPSSGPDDDHVFRKAWFELAEHVSRATISDILPKLHVLCADGKWRDATRVAAVTIGVPMHVRPMLETVEWLGLDEDEPPIATAANQPAHAHQIAPADLVPQVEQWTAGAVQRHVLGAAFSLTGSAEMDRVVQAHWLGDQDIDAMRRPLGAGPGSFATTVDVRFFVSASKPTQISVPCICGGEILVDVGRQVESLVEGEPRRVFVEQQLTPTVVNRRLSHIDVVVRRCDFGSINEDRRTEILKESAAAFGKAILGPARWKLCQFESWWQHFGAGSQAAIEPVRLLLLEDLPSKLEEFRVRDRPQLARLTEVVLEIRDLKLHRAQAVSDGQAAKYDAPLRKAHQTLGHLTQIRDIAAGLRDVVREHLGRFEYSAASVLLELFQNADDALAQLAAMRGIGALPDDARRVVIRVDAAPDHGGQISFCHWGRLINDHGGSSYPRGKIRQWDQDLYFMLRFLVSAKVSGEFAANEAQSTGQFGLGFKSVHFVSDAPVVRSGSLAFRVDAALLPAEVKISDCNQPVGEVANFMPTTITLPLRRDREARNLIDEMFSRISPIAALLPAMARQVCKVELPAEFGGAFEPDFEVISGAAGWQISRRSVDIGGVAERKSVRLLRYRSAAPSDGIATLVIAMQNGVSVALADNVPNFWVVAPTDERWGLGYAINGEFKLDMGRTRVSFTAEKTRNFATKFGLELAEALQSIVSAVEERAEVTRLLGVTSAGAFKAAFWHTLATLLTAAAAADRRDFLLLLHGNGSGLSGLIGGKCATPTGMPAQWPQFIGPLAPSVTVHVATEAAANEKLQPLFAAIPVLRDRANVVVQKVADVLKILIHAETPRFSVLDQLTKWSAGFSQEITPARAQQLAALRDEDIWVELCAESSGIGRGASKVEEWGRCLKFQAADGSMATASGLVLPDAAADHKSALKCVEESFDDELLRSAFAPRNAQLGQEYGKTPEMVDVFLRARGKLIANTEMLAKWAITADSDQRVLGAAKYLGRGTLSKPVAQAIRAAGRLRWAPSRFAWFDVAKRAELTQSETNQVAALLFDETEIIIVEVIKLPDRAEVCRRLNALWERWNNEAYRNQRLAELRKDLWPRNWSDEQITAWLRGSLASPETKRAWLVLFLLAHVQGLGLKGAQHRSFVEFLLGRRSKRHGVLWWDRLFGDGAPDATWTDFLDEWSRTRIAGSRTFDHWMRVLPDMYAATKWWQAYAEALRGGYSLAPQTDADLAGDYDTADVPAMAGAMRRYPWILAELEFFDTIGSAPSPVNPREGYGPSTLLTRVLQGLGFFGGDSDYRPYASVDVYNWLASLIGPDRADFHGLCATPLELDADFLLAG